jgi:glycosyltransferase involved in cell wall biosynthesis
MRFIFVNIMMGMYRGGGENYDLNVTRELNDKGHKIEMYFLKPVFSKNILKVPDYVTPIGVISPWLYHWTQFLHLIPVVGSIRGLRGIPRFLGQFIFEIRTFVYLWKRRDENFIIHVCGLGMLGVLCTKFLKKQVYVRYPGPPSFLLHNWFINNIYGVIANGDAYKVILERCPNANLIYLNVGIGNLFLTDHSLSKYTLKELNLPEDRLFLLFVGRLVQIKNIPMLLNTLSTLISKHKVDLIVVGDGPEKDDLILQAKTLNLSQNIHFIGAAYGERLACYYKVSDIFVLSSHYDNFPNVILEAMAMGLPVVATNVGGISKQVTHGETGYLVNPNNNASMSNYISDLLSNKEDRKLFGVKGSCFIKQNFDWKYTADKFLKKINDNLIN